MHSHDSLPSNLLVSKFMGSKSVLTTKFVDKALSTPHTAVKPQLTSTATLQVCNAPIQLSKQNTRAQAQAPPILGMADPTNESIEQCTKLVAGVYNCCHVTLTTSWPLRPTLCCNREAKVHTDSIESAAISTTEVRAAPKPRFQPL
eukprot:1161762-Pelagomonas_calceolata.AAC.5